MKCKFCNFPLLSIDSVHSTNDICICVKCPTPISFNSITGEYAIHCLHGEYWYDIIYLKQSKQYLIYQFIHTVNVNTEYGREDNDVEKKLLTQLPSEQTITPQNAHEKLMTILTFG